MTEQWEVLNGQQVAAGWPGIVAQAQSYRADVRVRWAGAAPCRDCSCAPGELHVPTCCLERCPGCGGQLLGCSCKVARQLLSAWPPEH